MTGGCQGEGRHSSNGVGAGGDYSAYFGSSRSRSTQVVLARLARVALRSLGPLLVSAKEQNAGGSHKLSSAILIVIS